MLFSLFVGSVHVFSRGLQTEFCYPTKGWNVPWAHFLEGIHSSPGEEGGQQQQVPRHVGQGSACVVKQLLSLQILPNPLDQTPCLVYQGMVQGIGSETFRH